MAVNEADHTSVIVIVRTVGLEERQQRCEVCVVVRRWCCSAHTGNEVSSCGQCGGTVVMELCELWLWESCVVLWDCSWASGGLPVASQHLIEKGGPEAQDGVAVGVVWPSLLA